ncbi:unnamed protein product, partial [Allacma fusca]
IFEAFREKCMFNFCLEAASYIGLPGFAFDAALRTSEVELEYLKKEDMYNMVERGIKIGICNVGSLRKAEANNPYMGDKYDSSQPNKYIIAWDEIAFMAKDYQSICLLEAFVGFSMKLNGSIER